MLLVPAFELGLWNAWVLAIPIMIVSFSDMRVTAARDSGEAGDFQISSKENLVAYAIFLPLVGSWVYSVFLPLQIGTPWLIGGLVIYLFGIFFTVIAIRNFGNAPKGKVITKGLYRFTRNPAYIGVILIHAGLGIACASWLFLLLVVVLAVLFNANLSAEERYLLYRYGDEYRKYKNSTPRWIGTPKQK